MRVWTLQSPTYLGGDTDLVGVFGTKEQAEKWAVEATPPVTDAIIQEWAVSDDRPQNIVTTPADV